MHYAKGKLKGDIREPDCDVMQRRVKRASAVMNNYPIPSAVSFRLSNRIVIQTTASL